MLTGRKCRLDLTSEQADYCEQIGNVCRAVWNTGLDQRRQYRKRGAYINYMAPKADTDQCRELAAAKREHPWLSEVPGHCLQQALKDLDQACRTHGTFRTRWRSARKWSPSFRFPEGSKIRVERLGKKTARAKLPKLGWVRMRWSRPSVARSGQPLSAATVSTGSSRSVSKTGRPPRGGTPVAARSG